MTGCGKTKKWRMTIDEKGRKNKKTFRARGPEGLLAEN